MNKRVQAFSQMQMWYHKHIIHIMIFFVLTGLPIFSEQFRFLAYIFGVPANWLAGGTAGSAEIFATGIQVARTLHRVMALIFALVSIPFVLVMLKDIGKWDIWPNRWGIGAFFSGMGEVSKIYLSFKHGRTGKYNAGQKLGAWVIITTTVLMAVSGFILMFRDLYSAGLVANMQAVHAGSFVVLGAMLVVHMYFGMHPINRHGLKAIFRTGEIDEKTVKEHHPLWYEKLKKE